MYVYINMSLSNHWLSVVYIIRDAQSYYWNIIYNLFNSWTRYKGGIVISLPYLIQNKKKTSKWIFLLVQQNYIALCWLLYVCTQQIYIFFSHKFAIFNRIELSVNTSSYSCISCWWMLGAILYLDITRRQQQTLICSYFPPTNYYIFGCVEPSCSQFHYKEQHIKITIHSISKESIDRHYGYNDQEERILKLN